MSLPAGAGDGVVGVAAGDGVVAAAAEDIALAHARPERDDVVAVAGEDVELLDGVGVDGLDLAVDVDVVSVVDQRDGDVVVDVGALDEQVIDRRRDAAARQVAVQRVLTEVAVRRRRSPETKIDVGAGVDRCGERFAEAARSPDSR